MSDLAPYRVEHRYVGRGMRSDVWLLVAPADTHDEALASANLWVRHWPGEEARVVTQHVIHRAAPIRNKDKAGAAP